MDKVSAGVIMFRRSEGQIEVLLVHPGGPFWSHKDQAAWTIPKGELEAGEDTAIAARREFEEETGLPAGAELIPLGEVRQRSGKTVVAFAFEGDCDPAQLKSNTFEMEWPPRSGRRQQFPEVDRGAFFSLAEAREKMMPPLVELLDRLEAALY